MGKTICLDFDGVINSYTSGWRGEEDIPDLPIFGTRDSINRLRAVGYKIVVHSCRCHSPIGRKAIENYLISHDIDVDDICEHKPQADYYVDDRAIKFDGVWEDVVGQVLEVNDTIQLTWGDFQLMSTEQMEDLRTINLTSEPPVNPLLDDEKVNMLNELFKKELAEAQYFHDEEGAPIH